MPFTLFSPPRHRELTASGAVEPGAKLYFYVSGTSTPASTYQDAEGTVAHSNPVVADTGGLFPAIWLDNSVIYDLTMKTSTGSTKWTVSGTAGISDELVLVSRQTSEPYADVFVRFKEPNGETKGYIGFTAVGDNTMSMTSNEDHRLKFRTGTPGDDTSFIDRVFMYGSAVASWLGIQAPAGTATGGTFLRFTTNDYSVSKGIIGFGSTSDDDIDIINQVSGGHIEFDTTGTGRIKMPLTDGSASAPMLTITGDPNTGIYSSGADTIDFSTGGTGRMNITTSAINLSAQARSTSGSAATPGYSFQGNTARGLYNTENENGIAYSHDGTATFAMTATGISLKDGVTAPSTVSGFAQIYVDTADGDLKVKFGDGTVKTIVVDT